MGEATNEFRVGSVPYLNAAPLVRGLTGRLRMLPPSRLAAELRAGRLDAGLVSITEVLLRDGYEVLDGLGVCSRDDVYSVFLAHRRPLEDVRTVVCDTASLTSVNLMRALLAERGLFPRLEDLGSETEATRHDAVLLIGDQAIRFRQAGHEHAIWDLGGAWRTLTGRPFVYAVWALRCGIENLELRRELRLAAERGEREIESIIREFSEFDEPFRRVYLTRYTHHRIGIEEKEGVSEFVRLLRTHVSPDAHEPVYVP